MDQPEVRDMNEPTSGAPPSAPARRPLFGLLELSIAAVIVVLDQATKAMVRSYVSEYQDLEVIPGFLNFTHVRNSGAAFGLFNAIDFPYKSAVIAIAAAAALVAIAAYAARLAPAQTLARVGLALILGGAIGNLIDRVAVGYVLDFVDVYWRSIHFWAFNVADSAITVGVGVMVLDMLGLGSHVSKTV